jgi:hypothetical protein
MSRLVAKISAPVSRALVHAPDSTDRATASSAALLLPCQAALQVAQVALFTRPRA